MITAAQLKSAVETFTKERDVKQRQLEQIKTELDQLNQAIEYLQGAAQLGSIFVVESEGGEGIYAGLGIQEAAERWMREVHNEPQETKVIADVIRSRGITTKARKFTQVVYTTLQGSGRFKRTADQKWMLREDQ